MLGLSSLLDEDKRYCLQTLKNNISLLTPEVLARVNVELVQAGYQLLDLEVHEMIRGRCDSFVFETNVHFPTDISLLFDVMLVLIRMCAQYMIYLTGACTGTT